MELITKGPIIKGQLYGLFGAVLWFVRPELQAILGSYGRVLGFVAICLISMGTYVLMDSRKNRESADEAG